MEDILPFLLLTISQDVSEDVVHDDAMNSYNNAMYTKFSISVIRIAKTLIGMLCGVLNEVPWVRNSAFAPSFDDQSQEESYERQALLVPFLHVIGSTRAIV